MLVCPRKAGVFSEEKSHQGKSQSPVYWWAGLLSFEKPMEQDADSIPSGGRQHDNHANREWIVRSCVV